MTKDGYLVVEVGTSELEELLVQAGMMRMAGRGLVHLMEWWAGHVPQGAGGTATVQAEVQTAAAWVGCRLNNTIEDRDSLIIMYFNTDKCQESYSKFEVNRSTTPKQQSRYSNYYGG